MGLTKRQKQILNNLAKYDPAWRGFNEAGDHALPEEERGFGSVVHGASGPTGAKTIYVEFEAGPDNQGQVRVGSIPEGGRIINCSAIVLVPFNKRAAISVGTTANPNLVLTDNDVDLSEVGTYSTLPLNAFDQNTEINAFFSNASRGKALILITF